MLANKISVNHNQVKDPSVTHPGEKALDTIVAKATAPGIGGVGIIRVSGTLSLTIAKHVLPLAPTHSIKTLNNTDTDTNAAAIPSKTLKPRVAEYCPFRDAAGREIDRGIALFFKGPHSLTGEDVLELQGHGGPVVMDELLQTVISFGARLARPGEFLERSFLNNKIDLVQAEAIHDLIHAKNESAARAAMRSLQGEFSRKINKLLESLVSLRMFVEASIDFPDEALDLLQEGEVLKRLDDLISNLENLLLEASRGAVLSEGLRVVIAGRPNAGKSSLLNKLSGVDAAIVTDIPGTTRDVLRQEISLDGLRLQLVDTAGIRDAGDAIEQEGIKRANIELSLADHIILVVDATVTEETDPKLLLPELMPFLEGGLKVTVLRNKIDAVNKRSQPKNQHSVVSSVIEVSVKTGEGIVELREHLKKILGFVPEEGNFTARRRHLVALTLGLSHLKTSALQLKEKRGFELVAEELRLSQLALDEITGKFTSDALLGKIFSEFCIGK